MPHTNHSCYEFGPYRLNLAQRLLTRDGAIIALTPKATDILALLVMNAGRVVEKDDLLKEVWADTFVEDANLAQNIFTLRRALGDERAGPKYIETVPRHGYRFIASVKACNRVEQETIEADAEPLANDDSAPPRIVVAVLPFINATDDDSLEYLAEGMTDNIINHLSRVSALRVMSRSAVFRHKRNEFDPQVLGKELGASAVLVGTISVRPAGIAVGVELVDVATGWQLWGESFDSESKDLLQIQDAITRQLLVNLKLKLTGEEETRVTARYTENPQAYQAYLEGRYHWSRYTRTGIEKAIGHFREAIELDPNYALAYAAIVDCYLRLATNYLPPEGAPSVSSARIISGSNTVIRNSVGNESHTESDGNVKLRFEWDWKGAERELRRANALNTNYPAAHQWYATYITSEEIYRLSGNSASRTKAMPFISPFSNPIPIQITLFQPTPSELAQVSCTIAREQIDVGNYDAASTILKPWWSYGEWPKLEGLSLRSSADLLFTAGELAGCVASTKQLPKGQKHGEALLNGSIAMFEQLRCKRPAAEARIELSLCYYRQGLFDLGRSMLERVLKSLSTNDGELRSLALIRLACLERHAGRLNTALQYLSQAACWIGLSGPWATGRCHLELASTYKDLGVSERIDSYFDLAEKFYLRALSEFQAVGNHRLTAIAENNLGFLLLLTGQFVEAESHLDRARSVFHHFDDRIRCAQADDSLARLYLRQERLSQARIAIERSIATMETGDEDALLAESLITKGMIYCKLNCYHEAQQALLAAYRLSRRCGHMEGAARAVLVIIEEMGSMLEPEERQHVRVRLIEALSQSQQALTKRRLNDCLNKLES
ncbi:MAG TPA: tetratricopeptide repeat protein [Pyrinomonadaceae bacterium]|nr:tetratricopeptide repeat protein [Pyrinomonadaceae bacterium]